MYKKILVLLIAFTTIASLSAQAKKIELGAKKVGMPQTQSTQFTLGLVQSSLKEGQSQTQVVSLLGSPNMVTRDSDGKDSWVYDKIYTETSELSHNAAATVVLIGWHRNSNRAVQTQKTMTVIIKFNKQGCVESYTYHNSQF